MRRIFFLAVLLVLIPACARKKNNYEGFTDFTPPDCSEELSIEDLVEMEEPYYEEDNI